jgi:hypothetical protein
LKESIVDEEKYLAVPVGANGIDLSSIKPESRNMNGKQSRFPCANQDIEGITEGERITEIIILLFSSRPLIPGTAFVLVFDSAIFICPFIL